MTLHTASLQKAGRPGRNRIPLRHRPYQRASAIDCNLPSVAPDPPQETGGNVAICCCCPCPVTSLVYAVIFDAWAPALLQPHFSRSCTLFPAEQSPPRRRHTVGVRLRRRCKARCCRCCRGSLHLRGEGAFCLRAVRCVHSPSGKQHPTPPCPCPWPRPFPPV